MKPEGLTPAAMAFISEVEEVCRRHGFALSPSQYDHLQVWPLKQGEAPLQFPRIEEVTMGSDAS